jgi:endo-1,4-beta-xylanase
MRHVAVTLGLALLALACLPIFGAASIASAHGDDNDSDQTPTTGRRPLRELAEDAGKLVGSAVDTTVLASDMAYRAVLAREFSSVTPENVMKWQLVEPQRGQLDFAAAERLVQFARRNGQLVRGHTLVWHNQLPN